MVKPTTTAQIIADLRLYPVVGIVGPRQVGKTTLARSLETQLDKPALYLDLESENDRRKDYEAARRWLGHFTTAFVERDLQQVLGWEVQTSVMLRFIRMLAHLHGKILNISDLANSLDTSTQTVNKYLALLDGAFFTTRIEPYFVNIGKRQT